MYEFDVENFLNMAKLGCNYDFTQGI